MKVAAMTAVAISQGLWLGFQGAASAPGMVVGFSATT
jgi:hypothetical protein